MTVAADPQSNETQVDSFVLWEPSLTAISNEAAALHREHFGRGPGATKSYVTDDLVICVMSDPFTVAERTLIDRGEVEHVLATRALHARVVEKEYRGRMAKAIGRPVVAYVGAVHLGSDMATDMFVLEPY